MDQLREIPRESVLTGRIERLERLVHRAVVGAEGIDEVLRRQVPEGVAPAPGG